MKLVRYGSYEAEKPGLIDDAGGLRDLSGLIDDIDPFVLSNRLENLKTLDASTLPIVTPGQRFGPPVADIGKIVCVGLNYVDHAEESNMAVPEEPVIFMKATSALNGPNDRIFLPPGAGKADWEVELAIVIGQTAKNISEDSAMRHVAGYCILNDVSERSYQLEHGGQWVKGKSYDSFAPLGPWLVTIDEVPDPHGLDLWLDVNGQRRQNSNTDKMIFHVPYLVSYISRFMTLKPGDVIGTGTPPGVGLGQNPPTFLSAGDEICLGISGLGEQRQQVVG